MESSAVGARHRWRTALAWAVVPVTVGLLLLTAGNCVPRFGCSARFHAEMDIQTLTRLVQRHAMENGGLLPDSLAVLLVPDVSGRAPLDMDRLPHDPWGGPYLYERTSEPPGFRILSLGADGRRGGEGEDRDVAAPLPSSARIGRPLPKPDMVRGDTSSTRSFPAGESGEVRSR